MRWAARGERGGGESGGRRLTGGVRRDASKAGESGEVWVVSDLRRAYGKRE